MTSVPGKAGGIQREREKGRERERRGGDVLLTQVTYTCVISSSCTAFPDFNGLFLHRPLQRGGCGRCRAWVRREAPISRVPILRRSSFRFTVGRLDVGTHPRPRGPGLTRRQTLLNTCCQPVPENLFDSVSAQNNVNRDCKPLPTPLQPAGEFSASQLGWFVIPTGFEGPKPGLESRCPAVGHSWELQRWGQGGRPRRQRPGCAGPEHVLGACRQPWV